MDMTIKTSPVEDLECKMIVFMGDWNAIVTIYYYR